MIDLDKYTEEEKKLTDYEKMALTQEIMDQVFYYEQKIHALKIKLRLIKNS